MEAQRYKRHVTCVNMNVRTIEPWGSIRFAMDVKRVKIGVAPREDDLQRRMEGGQRHVAADEKPTPDQRTDTLHDYTELIDAGWDKPRHDFVYISAELSRPCRIAVSP